MNQEEIELSIALLMLIFGVLFVVYAVTNGWAKYASQAIHR